MPLVTIDLLEGRPADELDAISEAIQEAMVEHLGVPRRDRFQIFTEHRAGTLRFDRGYLDMDRDDGFILIRVTLAEGRATEVKRAFYHHLAQLLAVRIGLRTENLSIVMVENGREDWSFGNGRANYLELPPERWR
jgi:phenylpyruvate tautomerase PptA (4-oxalocrotonate tautomerase family)